MLIRGQEEKNFPNSILPTGGVWKTKKRKEKNQKGCWKFLPADYLMFWNVCLTTSEKNEPIHEAPVKDEASSPGQSPNSGSLRF